MSIRIKTQYKGFQKSLLSIKELKEKVVRHGQAAALDKSTRIFQAEAVSRVPIGPTKLLKKSISTARSRKIIKKVREGITIAVVGPSRKIEGNYKDGKPYRPSNIAHLVEGGRKAVKPTEKAFMSRGGGRLFIGLEADAVPGRPFIEPAYESTKGRVIAEYSKILGQETLKAADKISRSKRFGR